MSAGSLAQRLRRREGRVAVVGLGYVGLPLAVEYARAGFQVLGLDIDAARVQILSEGTSYIPDVASSDVAACARAGTLAASTDFSQAGTCDVIVVCVPTPLDRHKSPDTSYIENVVTRILPFVRAGQLLVLESTTYPGTTRELVAERIRERGFRPGIDVHVAFSPERIDPGNARYKLRDIPKVVGGLTPACAEAAAALYETSLGGKAFIVSSPEAAEMTKLLENIFRIVNVSMVNEMAMLCDRMGVNIWEVIEAAKTKPFGFMAFYPGPGTGGHCIPIDAFYLSWKAREYGFPMRFIELAGEINDRMPHYVVARTAELLNERGTALRGSKILLLGLAYKRDVPDLRESPALEIAELLHRQGAEVSYHDPHVAEARLAGAAQRSRPLTPQTIAEADAVVITTDHSGVDYGAVARNARLLFDTRHAIPKASGMHLRTLGDGTKP